ncbi:unnamed protein product [Adineta steineri]|uniref:Uncharacterized protein n=1 Tax=Adineta steineri TaxID=433720 RepID=A0A819MR72_9BILA|nr:unnamed protein product [Adineta steineri]
MATPWFVKITYLPQHITSEQLAKKFGISEDDIFIPQNQEGPTTYAKVNGFMMEVDANEFVKRWNRTRILNATIKCKAVSTPPNLVRRRPASMSTKDNQISSQLVDCKDGFQCRNAKCEYNHPLGWDACEDGVDCEVFYCKANHPVGRTNPCPNGHQCDASPCNFLHPLSGILGCLEGAHCRVLLCQAWHPKKREKECMDGRHCYNSKCQRLHPSEWQACSHGIECTDYMCEENHPPNRLNRCHEGATCGNFYCESLHPIEWDPCEAGIRCVNTACPRTSHPADRSLSSNQEISSNETSLPRLLKSVEQRNLERRQAQLPIFSSKDEFCRRLKEERVLVITAETGSGKSTQLPQYAAEYFGGLVICTQPRVIAAVSLARRVANEYDGMPMGRSVGYRIGLTNTMSENNRVPGTDILFMTDGALIQESTEDRQLSNVRVLIIDEAHERSLNTDIVMGIAKLLLKTRPTDFYVVISSATINGSKFLDFFEQSDSQPLNVPGRVYDVIIEYLPKKKDDSVEEHAVNTLRRLYNQHQGTTLVFLPGQREIERAIELFKVNLPDKCFPFPLYAALSSEEQDQVLQFDEGINGERRMVVFCTNIAETSLTIKNTRLVIDSGLAKEANVDEVLRCTVIQTTSISKASADQRKGRAGRTAPGYCVRLYNENTLIRADIEPAILRSSLDLVVLQLIHLQLDPLAFPFIDPPDSTIIQSSLKILKDLSCITENYDITLRGELFVKLNLNPRFSAFFVDAYIEHGPILELAAVIVAILTAPGSVFLVGNTDEERDTIRTRVTNNAKEYESDLLYFASTYNKWRNIGILDPTARMCPTCHKSCNKGNICRPCRAAYSTTHLLNNKILNIVENVSNASIKTIEKSSWQLNPRSVSEANESDIIGINLYKHFPEHYGYLLKTQVPTASARMCATHIDARIIETSALIQRPVSNSYFIAMSIIKLPRGGYLLERLHPCRRPEDLGPERTEM